MRIPRTWVGWVKTRWPGCRALRRSVGIKARYAFVPHQVGSTESSYSAASFILLSDWATFALSVNMERRTADFSPSAPTRTSQVAVDPSSKHSSTGPVGRWVYDRSRFEQYILVDRGSLRRSAFWKSGRWKVIKFPGQHQSNLKINRKKPSDREGLRTLRYQSKEFETLGSIAQTVIERRNCGSGQRLRG